MPVNLILKIDEITAEKTTVNNSFGDIVIPNPEGDEDEIYYLLRDSNAKDDSVPRTPADGEFNINQNEPGDEEEAKSSPHTLIDSLQHGFQLYDDDDIRKIEVVVAEHDFDVENIFNEAINLAKKLGEEADKATSNNEISEDSLKELKEKAITLFRAVENGNQQSIAGFLFTGFMDEGKPRIRLESLGPSTPKNTKFEGWPKTLEFVATASGAQYRLKISVSLDPNDGLASSQNALLGETQNNLFLEGDDPIDGRGNLHNNLLVGNEANNTLDGLSGDDKIYGRGGNDTLIGGEGIDSMFGGIGDDTYEVDSILDSITERFNEGVDTVKSFIDYTLGDNLENLTLTGNDPVNGTGNSLDNVIAGNSANNTLTGLSGNDTLYGQGGNDLLNGGDGNDTLSGDAGSDTLKGEAGNDILDGGADNDILYDDAGNNQLFGGEGNDLLIAGAGNDLIDGGSGVDTVKHEDMVFIDEPPYGVIVNIDEANSYQIPGRYLYSDPFKLILTGFDPTAYGSIAAGIATSALGDTDTLRNLENITGSSLDDVLIGNSTVNLIQGLTGNDIFIGNAGNDTLDGGDGMDTASYRNDPDRVTINLEQNVVIDGFGSTDQLISIENIIGSDFGNNIIGNDQANILIGGKGDDCIEARGGNDTLYGFDGNDSLFGENGDDKLIGGVGADLLNGGTGSDTASYLTSTSGVTASLTLGRGIAGDAKGDIFTSIETLEGSEYKDSLIGDNQANTLWGLDGDDFLDGRDGNDTLDGGNGNDKLLGGDGNDWLLGQAGDDDLDGGTGNDNLYGGDGNDFLEGKAGDDQLLGEAGDDTFLGGTGNDSLYGGIGNDNLNGDEGNDLLDGGLGDDLLSGSDGDDSLFGADGIDYLEGGIGNDQLFGGAGEDLLDAGLGNDILNGGDGNDDLLGGLGNDVLAGGTGNDLLSGGSGVDRFIINLGDGFDTITDFRGIGRGSIPTSETVAEADIIQFNGADLIVKNMLLNQNGSDLEISFEGGGNTQVTLTNFSLENLDNLGNGPGTSIDLGNIQFLFEGQNQIEDNFDVFNAEWQNGNPNWNYGHVLNLNTVTFLNNLDNTIQGFDNSNDVINGQGGNDILWGLGGNDTLRGDVDNDTLIGGTGINYLTGNAGSDTFVLSTKGLNYVTDFTIGQDFIGLSDGLTVNQLKIEQGTGINSSSTWVKFASDDSLLMSLNGVRATDLATNMFLPTSSYQPSVFA